MCTLREPCWNPIWSPQARVVWTKLDMMRLRCGPSLHSRELFRQLCQVKLHFFKYNESRKLCSYWIWKKSYFCSVEKPFLGWFCDKNGVQKWMVIFWRAGKLIVNVVFYNSVNWSCIPKGYEKFFIGLVTMLTANVELSIIEHCI